MRDKRLIQLLVLLVMVVTLAGCAASRSYRSGEKEMRRLNYDKAVLDYSKALALRPGDSRYSMALARAKLKSAATHFEKGRRFADAGQLELSIAEFQQTLLLLPGHQYAANEMAKVAEELKNRDSGPSEIEEIKERARQLAFGPPRLDPTANIPILLNFTEVEVGKIFEAIGKASGINFIFDDKTDLDKPMTIDIGNVTLEKALDILMLQTKNFYKVIDDHTLLVAPDTRQKRQEYEDQVIRTFFLSNADTKQVVTLLRSLLQSRQIAENADLQSVTIKDTPDKVAIAERIINSNDKSKGEVLIDVELLEINRTIARTLGIDLSSKTLSLTFLGGTASVPLNNLDSLKQKGNWTVGVIPSVILNFLKSDSDTRLLAKPQLRVSEGEQAEILIGDRVPIPTTSFNTSQTVGGNIVPITSFTYQNVGITVQFEPRVHHNKDISLKVQVEFSQVTGSVETGGGLAQPIIGTRQIQTVIRLRDGETNLLAGLIARTNQDAFSGVAGLSEIPGIGRLLGNNNESRTETDIIMTVTPHIIRIPNIEANDLATLWVGTEDHMALRGPARNALNQSPFAAEEKPTMQAPPLMDTATTGSGGGNISRITPSAEVQRDRATPGTQPPGQSADAPDDRRRPSSGSRAGERGQPQGRDAEDSTDSPSGAGEPPGDDDRDPGDPESKSGEVPEGTDQSKKDAEDGPAGPAMVRLIPSKPTYSVGEPVVVEIIVQNASNVGSVPFHLRYNKEVLQYVPDTTTEGSFMRSDGTQTVFLANASAGGGEVVVGLSRLGAGGGVVGSGDLATFQFVAVAPGPANFSFSGSSVKDPQARNLPATFSAIPVVVEP